MRNPVIGSESPTAPMQPGSAKAGQFFATTSESYEQVFESGFPNGRGEDIPTTPTYIWEIRSDVAGIVGGPDDWVINVDSGTGCGVDNNTGCGQDFLPGDRYVNRRLCWRCD